MIDSRILVGLIAILIAVSGMVYVAIGEPDRQEEFKQAFEARSIESGAALFTDNCSECHGVLGQGIEGVAPTLNSAFFFNDRLKEIGYAGSLRSYITLTVAGGRPVKSDPSYPRNMPTWGVDYGGPLRNDQIDNIVAYIMNWESEAVDTGSGPQEIVPDGDTPEERGKNLFEVQLGCVGCHMIDGSGGQTGPELTNVIAEKGEDYVHQSIINPNAVIVEGYSANIMPQNFGDRLSDENLSDLIAYLTSVGN
ncbi:MAG: c-type cytochrome [Anaerolineae bacterium]|nr:c-type cytochrome [Anaerolineae bacterium]